MTHPAISSQRDQANGSHFVHRRPSQLLEAFNGDKVLRQTSHVLETKSPSERMTRRKDLLASRRSELHYVRTSRCGRVCLVESSGLLDRALSEFGTFIREEIAATSVAIGCLRATATQTLNEIQASGDHEGVRLIDAEVEGFTFVPRIVGLNGAQSLLRDVSKGGNIHTRLTQQLIVTVFTGWDAFHQARIAKARGVSEDGLNSSYFGDLRLLRNDIVHSRGVAKKSVRCAGAVLFRQLKAGDLIYLADDELAQLSMRVPYDELIGRH